MPFPAGHRSQRADPRDGWASVPEFGRLRSVCWPERANSANVAARTAGRGAASPHVRRAGRLPRSGSAVLRKVASAGVGRRKSVKQDGTANDMSRQEHNYLTKMVSCKAATD